MSKFIFTLACPDRSGIVHSVTSVLAANDLNILESSQYGDPDTKSFFMRILFEATSSSKISSHQSVQDAFSDITKLGGEWHVYDLAQKPKIALLVSKIGHVLNDLLFRHSSGQLICEIPFVVSNHDTFRSLVESHGIPFHHIPVTKETKAQAEGQLLDLIKQHGVECCVLARYMQVMSADYCQRGPATINVHHALLPAFEGAKAYHQAKDKGVKMVGATAHFASADLDAGAIIEQDVHRVNHSMSVKDLTQIGSQIESVVLARAVRWYLERRVFLNGNKASSKQLCAKC